MAKFTDKGYNVTKASTRYTRGGISDIYNTRVGWWERAPFIGDTTDLFFDISSETERRPDLISYIAYGDVAYTWLVLQYNNIVDVNEELVAGSTIKLPAPSRLNTVMLGNSSGGNSIET